MTITITDLDRAAANITNKTLTGEFWYVETTLCRTYAFERSRFSQDDIFDLFANIVSLCGIVAVDVKDGIIVNFNQKKRTN